MVALGLARNDRLAKEIEWHMARAEAELASAKREYAPDYSVQGGYMLVPNQTDGFLARFGVTWNSSR